MKQRPDVDTTGSGRDSSQGRTRYPTVKHARTSASSCCHWEAGRHAVILRYRDCWRNIAIALKTPQKGALSVTAWSIRGHVKDIFLPRPGRRRYFLAFQPLCVRRGWVVPRILCGSISVASLLRSDDVDRFLKLASRGGCLVGWQHIGLSEARGLVLSWVVREGIGVTRRLSASGHFMPTGVKDTHSRTRASQEPIHHSPNKSHRRWKGLFPETLKRLASSVSRYRSLLPSSTEST